MLYLIHRFQVQDEVMSFGAQDYVFGSCLMVIKFGLIQVCIVDLSVDMKYRTIATNMEHDFIYMDDIGGKRFWTS